MVHCPTLIRSIAIWEQDGLDAPMLRSSWRADDDPRDAPCGWTARPWQDSQWGARLRASVLTDDATADIVTLTAPLLGSNEGPARYVQMQLASEAGHPAAVEIWNAPDNHCGSLQWQHGWYSPAAAPLAELAPQLHIPEGVGLPGLAWQVQSPAYFGQLDSSEMFLRAYSAMTLGLQHGLAIPATGDDGIVVLLTGAQQPIARRLELAAVRDDGICLIGGHCQQAGALYASACEVPWAAPLMASALAARQPLLATRTDDSVTDGLRHAMAAIDAQAVLAWPFNDGRSGPMVMSLWV